MDPIIITGCARSGTSMSAGIVNICGAFAGDLQGPGPYNKRGMYENLRVRNEIIKPFFKTIGADPKCQRPLPNMKIVRSFLTDEFTSRWRKRVRNIYFDQGHRAGPWFIKDPKITTHWPIWNAAFPKAKWVLVRRDGTDIVNSCLKTGFMRAYKTADGWKKWVILHHRCFNGMIKEGLEIRQLWPQDMIDGDLRFFKDCIINFLDLEWKEKEVLNFITPALWSNAKRKKHGKN